MPETKTPTAPIFRLGRRPDPWEPPDWSRAHSDGTFGNRFDEPTGYYRVLYASSQRLSCFIETLAHFRADLSLLAELDEIAGEDDYVPLGHVPSEWCGERRLGTCTAHGSYADFYSAYWVGRLRQTLASECLKLGLEDLDVAILQQGKPRRLTQLSSLEVYKAGFNGIFYRSRYGHDLENWALFEPFQISEKSESESIRLDDPDLLAACEILRIQIGS